MADVNSLPTELELKAQELEIRGEEFERSQRYSALPLWVAILGGALTVGGGALANYFQERSKLESSLILKALDTNGDREKAAKNLKFLIDVHLIGDNPSIRSYTDPDRVPTGFVTPSTAP